MPKMYEVYNSLQLITPYTVPLWIIYIIYIYSNMCLIPHAVTNHLAKLKEWSKNSHGMS